MALQMIFGKNGITFGKFKPNGLEKLKAFRVESKVGMIITNYIKHADKKLRKILKENYPQIGYIRMDEKLDSKLAEKRAPLVVYVIYSIESSFELKEFILNLGRENGEQYILYANKDGKYSVIECVSGEILNTCPYNLFDENGVFLEHICNEVVNAICKCEVQFNGANEISLQNIYRDKLEI